jgi:hypothetical protein
MSMAMLSMMMMMQRSCRAHVPQAMMMMQRSCRAHAL